MIIECGTPCGGLALGSYCDLIGHGRVISTTTASTCCANWNLYGPMVTPGQYMIVEDTNINGNPVAESFGPGPKEAIAEFLPAHPEFTPDRSREKFFVTFQPGGYLLKR